MQSNLDFVREGIKRQEGRDMSISPASPIHIPSTDTKPLTLNQTRIKLRRCLRKQGVGRLNPNTKNSFVGQERYAVARYPHPPAPLGVSGCQFYIAPSVAAQRDALNPKPQTLHP